MPDGVVPVSGTERGHDTRPGDRYPIKLYDPYPCQGQRPDGKWVHFHDLLDVGDRVGDEVPGDPLNAFPPFGVVVRKADGLWIVSEAEMSDVSR